jgi:hypothetical protein
MGQVPSCKVKRTNSTTYFSITDTLTVLIPFMKDYSLEYIESALQCYPTLPMHWTEISKQILPAMTLRSLVPNFYIHVSVSNFYCPTIGPQMQCSKIGGPIVGIYKSLTVHECRNWERSRAVSFLGIFFSNFSHAFHNLVIEIYP